ncbi:hypothetical protein [Streptomyces sp. NBC_01353]|uniref:hypothetical protein n=1 Tax=Streptomyces sp. NBC_01353 TaxID=2903835 RepID=UPI003DA3341D
MRGPTGHASWPRPARSWDGTRISPVGHFPNKPHLAESFVEVSSLADPEWMIEIEAIGLVR